MPILNIMYVLEKNKGKYYDFFFTIYPKSYSNN